MLSGEALPAVDGPIATGLERYFSFPATLGTDSWVHLPTRLSKAGNTRCAALPTGATAIRASLGQIRVTFLRVEFLLFDGKGKGPSAIVAGQGFLLVTHI